MKQVFLSGEMLEKHILFEVLGITSPTKTYLLKGYRNCSSFKDKVYLIEDKTESVQGQIAELTDEQIWNLDIWKEVPALRRVAIDNKHSNNKQVIFIYTACIEISNVRIISDKMKEIVIYKKKKSINKNGMCDLHLLYPSVMERNTSEENNTNLIDENNTKNQEDDLSTGFINKMKECNNVELDGDFTKAITRSNLGLVQISVEYEGEEYSQYGFVYISDHQLSSAGMFSIVFPAVSLPVQLILFAFCGNSIRIIQDDAIISFSEWLMKKGLNMAGNPKAVVFAYSDISSELLINCLACELEPMGKIDGKIFKEWSTEDFAQYDVAKVYASNVCLIEIVKNVEIEIGERLNLQAIELFFVELLILQASAVYYVCNKVYSNLNHGFEYTKIENIQENLFKLSGEAANAISFVDYSQLRYPTARISSKKIAERFGINEGFDKYYKSREVLEQMIAIESFESGKREGKLMNRLLLILTMIQVIPTMTQVAQFLITRQIGMIHIESVAASILGCVALYVIYKIFSVSADRKSKERLYGKKKAK